MRTNCLGIVIPALLIAGCTSIRVRPVEATAKMQHVCIKYNPKVIVTDFVPVLQDGFARHGITTEVDTGEIPASCQFVLTYTALRSWDMAPYLSHAELTLETRDGSPVAEAEYHLVGKGGYSMMKWQGTKTKMDPVIDELLQAYPAQPVAAPTRP